MKNTLAKIYTHTHAKLFDDVGLRKLVYIIYAFTKFPAVAPLCDKNVKLWYTCVRGKAMGAGRWLQKGKPHNMQSQDY